MPRDHRIGLDQSECFRPVGPDPTNDHPEQAIKSAQPRARLFAFTDGNLFRRATDFIASRCRALRNILMYASAISRIGIVNPILIALA
jgi:hypothetical protein